MTKDEVLKAIKKRSRVWVEEEELGILIGKVVSGDGDWFAFVTDDGKIKLWKSYRDIFPFKEPQKTSWLTKLRRLVF